MKIGILGCGHIAEKIAETLNMMDDNYELYAVASRDMIKALEDFNNRTSDINQSRNIIPNLLNQIMFVIPENVQITSIENTTDKHIVIVAQSDKYEPLGYFKAKLNSDKILYNVISNSGVSDGSVIKVTIEGDLQ